MSNPYVQSRFHRIKDDAYFTIDARCVYSFLEFFNPTGLCVDICAPDGSGIISVLQNLGYDAVGIPDAFQDNVLAQWIITNPPYKRPLVDDIIGRQLDRIGCNDVDAAAMLLRTGFDHAKTRAAIFRDSPLYAGQIKMYVRPWWVDKRDKQPIHMYVWHIWARRRHRFPFVLHAFGDPPHERKSLCLEI